MLRPHPFVLAAPTMSKHTQTLLQEAGMDVAYMKNPITEKAVVGGHAAEGRSDRTARTLAAVGGRPFFGPHEIAAPGE